jgi:8-oxo-dGTP diphosphatase
MEANKMIVPVVAACIHNKNQPNANQFLLIKRHSRYKELDGKWELPGGFVENGETPEQALKREIKEELGFTIGINRIVYAQINKYKYTKRQFLVMYYDCWVFDTLFETLLKLGEYTFVELGDVPESHCLPGTAEAIARATNG